VPGGRPKLNLTQKSESPVLTGDELVDEKKTAANQQEFLTSTANPTSHLTVILERAETVR
jgi:hypothetical protein